MVQSSDFKIQALQEIVRANLTSK